MEEEKDNKERKWIKGERKWIKCERKKRNKE
jgi:hypothetical protein